MFKEFKISTLFDWKNGNTDLKKEHINGRGVPVVSSGVENTGIIGCTDVEARILPAHTITVDMFGNVYYRDFEYKEVTHARVFTLIPKGFDLNVQTGLYFVSSLKVLSKIYSYDNMCSYAKMSDMDISLPVIENPNPDHEYTVDDIDWQYMRERIAELERERIAELDAYLKATGLDDYELTIEDEVILKGFCNGTVTFKAFYIKDLFDIHPTSAYKLTNDELFKTSGNTPVLSNSSANNGIAGYSGLEPTEQGNIITFSDTTTGGDTMFYQDTPFIGYPHVQGMYPIGFELDKHRAEFFISVMRKATGTGFDYANKFRRNIVGNTVISLLVNLDGSINWEYIYIYIYTSSGEENNQRTCSVETKRNKRLQKYHVKFDEFRIDDVFEVVGTKSLDAGTIKFKEEGINFVGRTYENNGIQGKIDRQSYEPNDANTITATVIGNYKYVKYQEEPYYCSQNINKLTLRDKFGYTLNRLSANYLIALIRKFVEQYNGQQGGYKLPELKGYKILLPVTSDGDPDFNYMERYIRAIEKVVIADVVKYKDKTIATLKHIIS